MDKNKAVAYLRALAISYAPATEMRQALDFAIEALATDLRSFSCNCYMDCLSDSYSYMDCLSASYSGRWHQHEGIQCPVHPDNPVAAKR